jgi:hypothetical protein
MQTAKIILGLGFCLVGGLWYFASPTNTTWWLAFIPAMIGVGLLAWAGMFDYDDGSGGPTDGPWAPPPGDGGGG